MSEEYSVSDYSDETAREGRLGLPRSSMEIPADGSPMRTSPRAAVSNTSSGVPAPAEASTSSDADSIPSFPPPAVPIEAMSVDRYGFDRTRNRDGRSPDQVARDDAKERDRERKWIEMLRNYDAFFEKRRRKVKERIKKGIPDALRGRAWVAILAVNQLPQDVSVAAYYGRRVPPDDQTIVKDVPRTLPLNPLFHGREMQVSIYRVLRAYANCDKEAGYVQGMAFHAGILLCYLDEERAFRAFYQLFMGRGVRSLFCDRFRGLLRLCAVFEALVEKRIPRVMAHFRKCELTTAIFAPSWFLTAFIALDLPVWMVLRVFDCFVQFGVRALVSFALALCKCEEERLVVSDDVLSVLQQPGQRMECMSRPYAVIAEWHRQWITDEEWNAQLQAAAAAAASEPS